MPKRRIAAVRDSEFRRHPEQPPHCYFLDLPVELVDMITDLLPSRDLLSLRLSCKTLNTLTLNEVAFAFFQKKTFMLANEESMLVLQQISQHPKFSKTMRRIRFSVGTLHGSESDDEMRTEGRDKRPITRAQRREQKAEWRRLKESESQWRSGNNKACLIDILWNFKAVGSVPDIVATRTEIYDDPPVLRPWGYGKLRRKLGYARCLTRKHKNVLVG